MVTLNTPAVLWHVWAGDRGGRQPDSRLLQGQTTLDRDKHPEGHRRVIPASPGTQSSLHNEIYSDQRRIQKAGDDRDDGDGINLPVFETSPSYMSTAAIDRRGCCHIFYRYCRMCVYVLVSTTE